LVEGAVRVDLDGQPDGTVSAEDAVHARERLEALVKIEEEKLSLALANHYRAKLSKIGRVTGEKRRMTVDPGLGVMPNDPGGSPADARSMAPAPRQLTPNPGEVIVGEPPKVSGQLGLADLKRAALARRGG